MKQVNGHPYQIDIMDFKGKANEVVNLFFTMCDTFVKNDQPEINDFQMDYLLLAIMAGCADAHRNGFSNGIFGNRLDADTIQKFVDQLPKDTAIQLTTNETDILKKFVVWLMEPKIDLS